MVFSDDFLYFLKIKKKKLSKSPNYLVALIHVYSTLAELYSYIFG